MPDRFIHADATAKISDVKFREGHLKLKIDDIQKILDDMDVDIPFSGPLTTDATVGVDGEVYKATQKTTVEGISTTIDGSYTGGQIKLKANGSPLHRAGEIFDLEGLKADTLNLSAIVKRPTDSVLEISQLQASVGERHLDARGRIDTASEPAHRYVFKDAPLELEPLQGIDYVRYAVYQTESYAGQPGHWPEPKRDVAQRWRGGCERGDGCLRANDGPGGPMRQGVGSRWSAHPIRFLIIESLTKESNIS